MYIHLNNFLCVALVSPLPRTTRRQEGGIMMMIMIISISAEHTN